MKKAACGLTTLLLGAALAGCGQDAAENAAATGAPEEVTYARQLDVDLSNMTRTESGLYYRDLSPGTGPVAQAGSPVKVHYTGWLPNGFKFDSSRDAGEPFSFALGEGNVIAGWDEGVAGMRVGGRRRLVIPPELGYGARGAGGVIPPNATLVFDVELLEVR
jgi:FKBP-type peptidyl-prolyl cis-trans isomerase